MIPEQKCEIHHLIKNYRGAGKATHEKVVDETIDFLEMQGYRVINTEGSIPSLIACPAGTQKVIAVVLNGHTFDPLKGWKKDYTNKEMEKKYLMYDEIKEYPFYRGVEKRASRADRISKLIKGWGWNVVITQRKIPDAIACKDGKIIAVDVLGIDKCKRRIYNKDKTKSKVMIKNHHSWTEKQKMSNYEMYDDLFIVTFNR